MKIFFLGVLIFSAVIQSLPAEESEVGRLAAVIQSNAGSAEKEDACRRLKVIGNASSVPALATLLSDKHLYQAACDALETMPGTEAEAALLAALPGANGDAKAGIIHALGERRDATAVPALAKLLKDTDSSIADAAARALGKIGGKAAAALLRANLRWANKALRPALVDSLLECAVQFAHVGEQTEAKSIFDRFNSYREAEHVRSAAYAGLIRLAGDSSLNLILRGLTRRDAARKIVAMQLARDLTVPKATQAFTNLLRRAVPAQQAALIGLLQQRDDPAAAPAVLRLAHGKDAYVRLTAIAALGTLGDASQVPFLAAAAASRDEEEQKAARIALVQLRRGEVGAAMVQQLRGAQPAEQAELARALGGRWEKSAVPALLELARTDAAATRSAAVRTLSLLADDSHLRELVKLLVESSPAERADVRGVFESVVDRADPGKVFEVAPIRDAMTAAAPDLKIALLQVSALFADEQLRAAFRSALQDSDTAVRSAAARALCESRDPELIPDLLVLAKTNSEATLRALALDGYVRLVTEERSGFAPAKKLELLKPAFEFAQQAGERKRILSALGGVPLPGALALAESALADAAVQAEAEIACTQIAKALLKSDPDPAEAVLLRLSGNASTESARTNAGFILNQFDSGWRYAGPYREAGKAGNELFDVVFPPEQDATEVNWKRAPGSERVGEVVLNELTGGDNCVIYLKTRVFSPKAQPARLEIGSDDGIKLWVNGAVVHANNTGRGVAPAQDIAKAQLREGWNELRAKITQITGGCAMILEIKSVDGKKLRDLRFDPRGGS